MKIFKASYLFVYISIVVFGLFVLGLGFLPTSPLILFITFLGLLLIPGFSLAQIFKIKLQSLFEVKFLWLIIGLIYSLLICLVAILGHLNIQSLSWIYLLSIIFLFVLAFIFDYRKLKETWLELNFKKIFALDNLLVFGLAIFSFVIILAISQIGGSFDGDPTYHLSIMRKAIDLDSLSIGNLSFIKNQPMPAYAIMVWPVFLSLMAKITNLQIYDLWAQIPAVLTFLVMLSWYALFRKIFTSKVLTVLLAAIFIILMFEGTGYLLTRLAVPDTLAKLVLVPMALWLALKYVFDQDEGQKLLWVSVVFLPVMALVHLTQYFYFYLIMGAFIVLYGIFQFKDKDYWLIIKRMVTVTFANLMLAIPIFGWLQLKYGLVTASYDTLSSRIADPELKVDSVRKFDIFTKYAYVLFPLVLIFIRKNKTLLIVFGSMLIAPIIFHIGFIYDFMNAVFSFVFMKRLFSNVTWYYAIWAIILGFAVLAKDRFVSAQSKIAKYIYSGLIVLASALIFFFREAIYCQIFSSTINKWLEMNFWWLLAATSILSLVIYFWQRRSPKLTEYFELKEPKYWLTSLVMVVAIISVFAFGSEKTISSNLKSDFFSPIKDYRAKAVSAKKIGGWDTLDFIKANIPQESIFESDLVYRDLPIMYNIHMAAWPNKSLPEKEYSKVYEAEGDTKTKLQCLAKGKADYLLVSKSKVNNLGGLKDYLSSLYQNGSVEIFKINQPAILANLDGKIDSQLDCRARQYQK